MFFVYFIPLLSLFAFGFIETMDADENIAVPEVSREMDDLKKLTWPTYCKFQKNERRCQHASNRRYYYDLKQKGCYRFDYAGCNHTYNMFTSLHRCRSECQDVADTPAFINVTENVYCRYQPDFGSCNSYHPMWYFDVTEMKCKGFSFSGCGGNYNRFETANKCLTVCGPAMKHDEEN